MKEFSEFKIFNHLGIMQRVLAGERPAPITVEIDPTNACNHSCIWCIDGKHRNEHFESLDKEVLFSALEDMARMGVEGIVVKGGGEPLVYPHIDATLEHIRSLGMKVGIITNGELIGEHREAIEDTCEWLRISFDAGTPHTHQKVHRSKNPNAFEDIIHNITQISEHMFTGMIFVVHTSNYHEMPQAAALAKLAGCRYIAFKKVILPARDVFTPELLMTIDSTYIYAKKRHEDDSFHVAGFRIYDFTQESKPKPYGLCKAHHLIGIVCANGMIYACCSTRGNSDYCFGSLAESSFEEIWNGDRRKEVLEKIDSGACAHICMGKTSYMRYDHYNDLFQYLACSDRPHKNFL